MKAYFTIQKFLKTLEYIPTNVSVLIRGDHGIGKSQIVKEYAEFCNLPLIDRRLSQMGEGDLIGLPLLSHSEGTSFIPVDWFIKACKEPVLLFLDELNRASNEVLQIAFQIVLDRELNGYTLHPETRIFCAINSSKEYNVNPIDPALLDRFWVCDLQPTSEEWINASKTAGIHPLILSFIQKYPKWLDPHSINSEEVIDTSRRSWWRLSHSLQNIPDPKRNTDTIYNVALGYLGIEASIALVDYIKNWEHSISPSDILDTWDDIYHKIPLLNISELNNTISALSLKISSSPTLSTSQCSNISKFMSTLPNELKISFWSNITNSNSPSIPLIHKHCVKQILAIFDETPPEAQNTP